MSRASQSIGRDQVPHLCGPFLSLSISPSITVHLGRMMDWTFEWRDRTFIVGGGSLGSAVGRLGCVRDYGVVDSRARSVRIRWEERNIGNGKSPLLTGWQSACSEVPRTHSAMASRRLQRRPMQ